MKEVLETIQDYLLPVVTLALTYYGWRATSEKNRLKSELKGLELSNTSKDIENQKSWLELYHQLHNDQAQRMIFMEKEIQSLKKTIKFFEHAFKKVHSCQYVDVCPVAIELQKHEANNRKRTNKRPATNRQREPADRKDYDPGESAEDDGDSEADA